MSVNIWKCYFTVLFHSWDSFYICHIKRGNMISLISQDLKTTMALFVYLSINIMEMASKACFMIGHYAIQSRLELLQYTSVQLYKTREIMPKLGTIKLSIITPPVLARHGPHQLMTVIMFRASRNNKISKSFYRTLWSRLHAKQCCILSIFSV